ncbi:MAG: bifunctional folylpolyglutamate synthase/dihydrofolate synthase [Candidatus Eremiobacteraeota bacterium]|nr:bifunctional folylpolyglutamate synthase/dihydrofolate synthase [Candidatus Eremiobacteraeota bacterium]
MDYRQAEAYLLGTIDENTSRREPYRLDRIRAFLRELGDPQNAYPTIHVGGTSGKGSTCTLVASMLAASGKRTGLHTKPHLRSMTERARVDGLDVPEERFAELLSEMMPAIERSSVGEGRPSYYETLLALAFLHFARERVDVAVIEVGLGGTLDGTNVIVPEVSAITTIGLDHTEILGDTLEKIAADKAGIAKPGVPLICGVTEPGARAVIEAHCAAVGTPFVPAWETTTIEVEPGERYAQHFAVTTPKDRYDVRLPLLGAFQRTNAALALRIVEHLKPPLRPSRESCEGGLATAMLAGRMEFFPAHPGVVFDVAHNPEKAARLTEALREQFPDRHFWMIVAIGTSKDAGGVVRALGALPATFVFTSFEAAGREAIKPQRLASIAEDAGSWGRAVADPIEALTIARRNASADDIVVVTGSTLVVAELREWWFEHVATVP